MTKPVAYLAKSRLTGKLTATTRKYPDDSFEITPLYTADQLHPRVKMTKKQYNRLMWDQKNTDLSNCLGYFLEHDGVNKFGLSSDNLMGFLTQEDIARAWLNPEATIEIVPDMNWFVRSKKAFPKNGKYLYLDSGETDGHYAPEYHQLDISYATQFDTKEEAERWTNPLTEAVQLPVEGE